MSTSANGKVTVNIAPPNTSGISKNSYTAFNVSPAGLNFNNLSAGARTILNQVTGPTQSQLRGPVEVLGTRAHIVIANPNGIVVDGARFINTGGLALTTGDITFKNHPVAPGLGLENIVIDVHGGSGPIVIENGGLSGAFTFLEVLARKITVDGPLTNDSTDPLSTLRLTAGSSTTELDSFVNPNTTDQVWAEVTPKDGGETNEILVDITQNGTLSASNITIAVNDKGAGVRHAGVALARAGEFKLSSNGLIEIPGGDITAQTNVTLDGEGLIASAVKEGGTYNQATVNAVDGIFEAEIGNGGIVNLGSIFQGNSVQLQTTGDFVNDSLAADALAMTMATAGDLSISAEGDFSNYSGLILAPGNVVVDVGGSFRNQTKTLFPVGYEKIEREDNDAKWWQFWKSRRKRFKARFNDLEIPGALATISGGGSVVINADGSAHNLGGTINASTGSLIFEAASLENIAIRTGHVDHREHGWYFIFKNIASEAQVQTFGGSMLAGGEFELTLDGDLINTGGTIFSGGDLTIEANDIVANPVWSYSAYDGPQGIRELWEGKRKDLLVTGSGNQIISQGGEVKIATASAVKITAGTVEGAEGVTAPAGIEVGEQPDGARPFGKRKLGFLRWLERDRVRLFGKKKGGE